MSTHVHFHNVWFVLAILWAGLLIYIAPSLPAWMPTSRRWWPTFGWLTLCFIGGQILGGGLT